MKYQAQLTPWVIYQVNEGASVATHRFRKRNDADAYVNRLRLTQPSSEFKVEFDSDSFIAKKAGKDLATV
ncbi:MAG: hypothetical protein HC860_17315 [Alkalinema sp. RU_4_3]|jgi:hypothetical protein|nr:hypothetical protein [Alkalinema sp. RU_4_3]